MNARLLHDLMEESPAARFEVDALLKPFIYGPDCTCGLYALSQQPGERLPAPNGRADDTLRKSLGYPHTDRGRNDAT